MLGLELGLPLWLGGGRVGLASYSACLINQQELRGLDLTTIEKRPSPTDSHCWAGIMYHTVVLCKSLLARGRYNALTIQTKFAEEREKKRKNHHSSPHSQGCFKFKQPRGLISPHKQGHARIHTVLVRGPKYRFYYYLHNIILSKLP